MHEVTIYWQLSQTCVVVMIELNLAISSSN